MNGETEKHTVVHPPRMETTLSSKKEWSITSHGVDGSPDVKRKKPNRKACTPGHFMYVAFKRRQSHRERNQIGGCPVLGVGGENADHRETGGRICIGWRRVCVTLMLVK